MCGRVACFFLNSWFSDIRRLRFSHSTKFVSHFLMLLLVAAPLACANQKDSAVHLKKESGARLDTSASTMLKGQVEHSDSLAPLNDDLRAGAQFDRQCLPAQSTAYDWFWIPSWFAGIWQATTEKRTFYLDYETAKIDRLPKIFKQGTSERWGEQQDRKGGFWEYAATPYCNTVDGGDVVYYEYVSLKKPIKVSANEVTMLFRSTSVAVNKKTNMISSSEQIESVQVYKKIAPGLLECSSSIKEFDQGGIAVSLVKRAGPRKLTAKFRPLDQFNGQSLHMLFMRFLQSKRLNYLIPS